jgi:hypothetical protein
MTNQATMDRIRTLLAIADGGSPYAPERELARERAEKLMLRHSIDAAAARFTASQRVEPQARLLEFTGTYVIDQAHLAATVLRVFGCRAVEFGRGQRVQAYGFAEDLTMACALVDALVPQMLADMRVVGGSVTVRKSFARAFAVTVRTRLEDFYAHALDDAEQEGTSSALVVADRSDAVDAVVEREHPRLRWTRARPVYSSAGWEAGAASGRRADIALGHTVGADHSLAVEA